jgi:hypothetical protein
MHANAVSMKTPAEVERALHGELSIGLLRHEVLRLTSYRTRRGEA